jgi:hypothetical protein
MLQRVVKASDRRQQMDTREMNVLMLVGLNTVITAIHTGDTRKAVEISLVSSVCYLMLAGVVWAKDRFLWTGDHKIRRTPRRKGAKPQDNMPRAKRSSQPVLAKSKKVAGKIPGKALTQRA